MGEEETHTSIDTNVGIDIMDIWINPRALIGSRGQEIRSRHKQDLQCLQTRTESGDQDEGQQRPQQVTDSCPPQDMRVQDGQHRRQRDIKHTFAPS